MKYFPINNTLLLLQTNYYPNHSAENSVFYYLEPYNTSTYNALTIYDNDSYYYSLDRFSSNLFLATGELKALSHSFLIHDIMSVPQTICLIEAYETINTNNPPNPINLIPQSLQKSYSQLNYFLTMVDQLPITTKCKEP